MPDKQWIINERALYKDEEVRIVRSQIDGTVWIRDDFGAIHSVDPDLLRPFDGWRARAKQLEKLLNTPELIDFGKAVPLEAMHQRERWGGAHDAAKEPQDWFWTLGYLGGKAMRAHLDGDREKALHHTITAAALLANWHARILTDSATPTFTVEKKA